MLPKFRPATLGRDAAQARPSIRPVKPSPPPPPPSPPRRMSSGFGPRSKLAQYAAEAIVDQPEVPTATGYGDPATLSRGPETVPTEDVNTKPRARANVVVSFEDETQARRIDDRVLDELRQGYEPNVAALAAPKDLGVEYDSLPSLEVRRPFDTYEAEFSERDPVTQYQAARESKRMRRAKEAPREPRETSFQEPVYKEASYREPEASYREPEASYREPEPSYPASSYVQDENDFWGRREESGPRARPSPDRADREPAPAARPYAAPVPSYDDASDSAQWGRDRAEPEPANANQGWSSLPPPVNPGYDASDVPFQQPVIPPAPRVPNEMRPAFVVGVQPIRTATPDAWGTPHAVPPAQGQYLPSPMQAMQSSMPAQYAYAQNPPYAQQQQPSFPQPMQQAPARVMTPHPNAYAQQQIQQQVQQQVQQQMQLQQAQGFQSYRPAQQDSAMQRAQPVGAQLADASAANKVGRFAWFVAGAAFGITFAFFATGLFNGANKTSKQEFPTAPALMAPAATAPPVALAPTAPTAIIAPVTPAVPFTPATLPAAAPTAPPVAAPQAVAPPVTPVAPVAPSPPVVRAAPPPRAPRFSPPPRRPASPPASQAPRNLGGGGPGGDDAPSAPAPSAPSGDIGDLLGAGLKP
jgi:hypothetical protein